MFCKIEDCLQKKLLMPINEDCTKGNFRCVSSIPQWYTDNDGSEHYRGHFYPTEKHPSDLCYYHYNMPEEKRKKLLIKNTILCVDPQKALKIATMRGSCYVCWHETLHQFFLTENPQLMKRITPLVLCQGPGISPQALNADGLELLDMIYEPTWLKSEIL